MGGLRRARDVQRRRTAGSPTGREPYGDGVPIVVAGVTTCQGGRESRATGRRGTGDREVQRWEACGMQSAETVLDVIRERGRRGLPLERLYRQLFNPQLYLLAYGRIYANHGCDDARGHRRDRGRHVPGEDRGDHRRAARRALPMDAGQAGLHPEEEREAAPAGPADLVGQTGRRSGPPAAWRRTTTSSSPTAPTGSVPAEAATPRLDEVVRVWKGTHWFIEGDISDCFGSLDHQVMLSILAEKIHDGRFLRLIEPDAQGRVPGGLAVARHAERRAARRGRVTRPVQHLP